MEIIRRIKAMQQTVREWQRADLRVGLVPTMGALHEGHLSLVRLALEHCERAVVSIFVNPTQFGPQEDLDAYPRAFEADRRACEEAGVAVLFAPTAGEMYAPDFSTWVTEEALSQPLCGRTRPGHFRGVTTVVLKLFTAVLPDVAVFGRKDAQQELVIRRMVRDLNMPVKILTGPIVRERDGLAMSSRNRYLDAGDREAALAIHRGLEKAKGAFSRGERTAAALTRVVSDEIRGTGGDIDYVECVYEATLEPVVGRIDGISIIAVAARYGPARLLDNTTLCP